MQVTNKSSTMILLKSVKASSGNSVEVKVFTAVEHTLRIYKGAWSSKCPDFNKEQFGETVCWLLCVLESLSFWWGL